MAPSRPTRRVLAAVLALAVLALAPGRASADPVVDDTRAQLAHVKAEVAELDARAEQLTERYDRAVYEVQVLQNRIDDATARLADARRRLVRERAFLGRLMVARYKGGTAEALSIVVGASSLSQVTGGIDLQQRYDQAVADTVAAIAAARAQIAAERRTLVAEHRRAVAQQEAIDEARAAIRAQLARRRDLLATVADEVRVAEAADRAGQAELALKARDWIMADMKANAHDPGALLRDRVVLDGLRQIGVPYLWGGATPQGFDCSGLVMWLYARQGVVLPHYTKAQYAMGPTVAEEDLAPGDLVFFHDLSHVGLYIGNGYVLHAPHTGTTVQIEPFSMDWFTKTFDGATRPGPA